MKKILAGLSIALLSSTAYAGLITRTYTYTSGNTITANENNTNENTLYNEINGNIETTNIKDGTIQNGDIADTQIAVTKFASAVQSTFTWVNTHGFYRRPGLVYVSATTVDVDSNTGTANETCIQFPDERRCVTESTGATDKYRRFIITSTATFVSGTEDSGMMGAYASNTWIAMYAVKSQINTANFVIAGTTNTPVLANYATLNTMFGGSTSWVYLGMIRNGDGTSASNIILLFSQVGNFTQFVNKCAGTAFPARGIRMATTTGTSLGYALASGTSGAVLPAHVMNGATWWTSALNPNTNINMQVYEVNTSGFKFLDMSTGGAGAVGSYWYTGIQGAGQQILMRASNNESDAMDIFLSGFYDTVLVGGYNPQM